MILVSLFVSLDFLRARQRLFDLTSRAHTDAEVAFDQLLSATVLRREELHLAISQSAEAQDVLLSQGASTMARLAGTAAKAAAELAQGARSSNDVDVVVNADALISANAASLATVTAQATETRALLDNAVIRAGLDDVTALLESVRGVGSVRRESPPP